MGQQHPTAAQSLGNVRLWSICDINPRLCPMDFVQHFAHVLRPRKSVVYDGV
jgi:hypothetical protein